LCIVPLEGGAIIPAIVAEDGSAALDMAAIAHELVPIIMSNFMPEMAEQRAIWLAHEDPIRRRPLPELW
jgi:hypothetical protein